MHPSHAPIYEGVVHASHLRGWSMGRRQPLGCRHLLPCPFAHAPLEGGGGGHGCAPKGWGCI